MEWIILIFAGIGLTLLNAAAKDAANAHHGTVYNERPHTGEYDGINWMGRGAPPNDHAQQDIPTPHAEPTNTGGRKSQLPAKYRAATQVSALTDWERTLQAPNAIPQDTRGSGTVIDVKWME